MIPIAKPAITRTVHKGSVHCPSCTHNVPADVVTAGRQTFAKPGQKCPRCSSTLDAAYVMHFEKAA